MAGPGELVVNVTCGSRRLHPVVIANTIPFPKFKHLVSPRVRASILAFARGYRGRLLKTQLQTCTRSSAKNYFYATPLVIRVFAGWGYQWKKERTYVVRGRRRWPRLSGRLRWAERFSHAAFLGGCEGAKLACCLVERLSCGVARCF